MNGGTYTKTIYFGDSAGKFSVLPDTVLFQSPEKLSIVVD
jgi:hypothetical protein